MGNAAFTVLQEYHSVTGYDIDGRGLWKEVISSDAALVCVSTDAGENNRLDMSNINSVAKRLSDDGYQGVMIVKSTLQPGAMDSISNMYPNYTLAKNRRFNFETIKF